MDMALSPPRVDWSVDLGKVGLIPEQIARRRAIGIPGLEHHAGANDLTKIKKSCYNIVELLENRFDEAQISRIVHRSKEASQAMTEVSAAEDVQGAMAAEAKELLDIGFDHATLSETVSTLRPAVIHALARYGSVLHHKGRTSRDTLLKAAPQENGDLLLSRMAVEMFPTLF